MAPVCMAARLFCNVAVLYLISLLTQNVFLHLSFMTVKHSLISETLLRFYETLI